MYIFVLYVNFCIKGNTRRGYFMYWDVYNYTQEDRDKYDDEQKIISCDDLSLNVGVTRAT